MARLIQDFDTKRNPQWASDLLAQVHPMRVLAPFLSLAALAAVPFVLWRRKAKK